MLADANLELVPPVLRDHPAVVSAARRRGKKPGEMLLDKSLHYAAMRKLRDHERRGRPDITHVCLLVAQSSMLNARGLLETLIHTVNGEVIAVKPETRVPRHYLRFVGLMEQLLLEGRVPPRNENPLMWKLNVPLGEALRERGVDFVALLSEGGEIVTPRRLAELLVAHERPAFIVGAFAHGDFSEEVKEVADKAFSLGSHLFDAWYVVARLLTSLEDVAGVWHEGA